MQAFENDNNEQTNCQEYKHSTMDGLYDESIANEENHILMNLLKSMITPI